MDGYNYNPNQYGHPPPGIPLPSYGQEYPSNNNPSYPPPFPPSSSFGYPPHFPPSSSFSGYPTPFQTPYNHPYTSPQPYPSFATQPSLNLHESFHHDSFHYNSGELQHPPPHSDSFHSPYGWQGNSSTYAAPQLEGMLANVTISEQTSTVPTTSEMYRYPSNTSDSSQMPHSAAVTPFNGSQHGGQDMGHIALSGSQHAHGSMHIMSSRPSMPSLRVLLLHGNLDVWVFEAKNLPNMDTFSNNIMLGINKSSTTSDPYVTFSLADAVLGRTYVISNNENPIWNQHFYVPVAHHAAQIKFMVKDSDVVGSELIGTVEIPAEQIYTGMKVEGVYPVLGSNGKPCRVGAVLKISIQYIPVESHTMYHQGVGLSPDYLGVPGTYFPLRKGGNVRLYQDAHVPDGCLPNVSMENGMQHMHGKCWLDISEAIIHARRLIYITGWSVYHKVQLIRDAQGSLSTLGDLLKSKSQEGVRVLLLVWDDPTSQSILGYRKDGLMQTHDEETHSFFKNSSVHVLLCPRSTGKRHGLVKKQETGLIYTHHQKTVIVDSDAGNNRRKIIAFVGGLDLCDGRYDTPKHPIFRTLQTLHKDDYHNPTFTVPNDGHGPREPWHDLHTRIDGPAAYDVLQNFEERWLKASKRHGVDKLKRSSEDMLLQIERISEIIGRDQSSYMNDTDPETWHVQIFRSIDSNSVKGFPKNPKDATSKNLVCGKNILVDMSIHTAYVKAIRAAQHFIYIENQYFLGSSFNWDSYRELGANNLIPMELALKIASKIKLKERFSVYIVIPMWPEGNPNDLVLQRILLWQNKTMQMMYKSIYKALIEAGLQNQYTPHDYLNFFCLGNREALDNNMSSGKSATTNTPNRRAQKSRRFMIYVHSKGMIVDDEYLIVGSANINQRSLEGTRDTEIAMGAYQPQHTWAAKRSGPCGQIFAYRMSLWAEHTGVIEECFNNPKSLECIRRVKTMGELNWKQFISDEVTEMTGHLLKYPIDVDAEGKVRPLPGCETFPDVGGNICGSIGTFVAVQENLTI